jgi:hypothetical protein
MFVFTAHPAAALSLSFISIVKGTRTVNAVRVTAVCFDASYLD